MMVKKPVVLIIRDGWGINPGGRAAAEVNGDATLLARTPFHDELYGKYPWGQVSGSGEDVGLPAGQMGNSEVGHLNMGAGRIVVQELKRIDDGLRTGVLFQAAKWQALVANWKKHRGSLHLLGLLHLRDGQIGQARHLCPGVLAELLGGDLHHHPSRMGGSHNI
jgi:2,3-bisphosphoglycerate-independent phosphoglycerate mutase